MSYGARNRPELRSLLSFSSHFSSVFLFVPTLLPEGRVFLEAGRERKKRRRYPLHFDNINDRRGDQTVTWA